MGRQAGDEVGDLGLGGPVDEWLATGDLYRLPIVFVAFAVSHLIE